MADQLTTEQMLLLNNMMYMNDEGFADISTAGGETVGSFLNHIDISKINDEEQYSTFVTGADWKKIIEAVQQDEQLCNLQIKETYVDNSDNGGGGLSALFVDPSTNDAMVVFRGTAANEWKDDFIGGGPTDAQDGVSTPNQESALEWFQSLDLDGYHSVTTSGHSKGGNKAKYITVMDDSVDRCVSFDGQGFSDEFLDKYANQIAGNQGKIENNNAEMDYVNLLLNDIGNTTFYEGYDYGKGQFLENHCPNTIMKFNEDGTFTMVPGDRNPAMAELDQFLNSYLRTLDAEDKADTLAMIGDLVEMGFAGEDPNKMLQVLLAGDNVDLAADLLGYLLKYEQENPEFKDAINEVFTAMGLENILDTVNVVEDVINSEHFDFIFKVAGGLLNLLPDFILNKIIEELEKKGIHLTREELEKLLNLVSETADSMKDARITDTGADLTVSAGGVGRGEFRIDIKSVKQERLQLAAYAVKLTAYGRQLDAQARAIRHNMPDIQAVIYHLAGEVSKEAAKTKGMADALDQIILCYEGAERRILAKKR